MRPSAAMLRACAVRSRAPAGNRSNVFRAALTQKPGEMLAIFLYVVKLDNDYQHNEKLRELVKTSAEWFKENNQSGGI